MVQLVNPAPGGTQTRTDQGVDWGSIRGNIVAVAGGVITQVYHGLQGFGTTVIERLRSGQDVYYGLETGGGNPVVHPGQQVAAGQAIAPGLGSGGIEVGWWNTSTGRALGAPDFGGSNATPAGQNFRAAISSHSRVQNVPSYVPAQYVSWVQQASSQTGLPPGVVAAQINAETGFNPSLTSSAGAKGLAQFLDSTFQKYVPHGNPFNTNDALRAYVGYMNDLLSQYNGDIRKALAAYNAGPANLSAGYGYADGILRKAGLGANAHSGAKGQAITRPGGQPAGASQSSSQVDQLLADYETLLDTPRTSPASGFTPVSQAGWRAPFQWWYQSFTSNWKAEQSGS